MISNKDDSYSTDDTQLATYLYLQGFKITDIDYSDPQRAKFVFHQNGDESNDINKLHEHAYLFRTMKTKVEPSDYIKKYRRLCSIVRRQAEWHEGIL